MASCIVESCSNDIVTTPYKSFFLVPYSPVEERRKWFKSAGVDLEAWTELQASRGLAFTAHCCEDHFDLSSDVYTAEELLTISGPTVSNWALKPGCYPRLRIVNNFYIDPSGETPFLTLKRKNVKPDLESENISSVTSSEPPIVANAVKLEVPTVLKNEPDENSVKCIVENTEYIQLHSKDTPQRGLSGVDNKPAIMLDAGIVQCKEEVEDTKEFEKITVYPGKINVKRVPKNMPQAPECGHDSDDYQCDQLDVRDITAFFTFYYNLPTVEEQDKFLFSNVDRVTRPVKSETQGEDKKNVYLFFVEKMGDIRCRIPVCCGTFCQALAVEPSEILPKVMRYFDERDADRRNLAPPASPDPPPPLNEYECEPIPDVKHPISGATPPVASATGATICLKTDGSPPCKLTENETNGALLLETLIKRESPWRKPTSTSMEEEADEVEETKPNLVISDEVIYSPTDQNCQNEIVPAEIGPALQPQEETRKQLENCYWSYELCHHCLAIVHNGSIYEAHRKKGCKRYKLTKNDFPVLCAVCSRYESHSVTELKKHVQTSHRFVCTFCTSSFTDFEHLRRHFEESKCKLYVDHLRLQPTGSNHSIVGTARKSLNIVLTKSPEIDRLATILQRSRSSTRDVTEDVNVTNKESCRVLDNREEIRNHSRVATSEKLKNHRGSGGKANKSKECEREASAGNKRKPVGSGESSSVKKMRISVAKVIETNTEKNSKTSEEEEELVVTRKECCGVSSKKNDNKEGSQNSSRDVTYSKEKSENHRGKGQKADKSESKEGAGNKRKTVDPGETLGSSIKNIRIIVTKESARNTVKKSKRESQKVDKSDSDGIDSIISRDEASSQDDRRNKNNNSVKSCNSGEIRKPSDQEKKRVTSRQVESSDFTNVKVMKAGPSQTRKKLKPRAEDENLVARLKRLKKQLQVSSSGSETEDDPCADASSTDGGSYQPDDDDGRVSAATDESDLSDDWRAEPTELREKVWTRKREARREGLRERRQEAVIRRCGLRSSAVVTVDIDSVQTSSQLQQPTSSDSSDCREVEPKKTVNGVKSRENENRSQSEASSSRTQVKQTKKRLSIEEISTMDGSKPKKTVNGAKSRENKNDSQSGESSGTVKLTKKRPSTEKISIMDDMVSFRERAGFAECPKCKEEFINLSSIQRHLRSPDGCKLNPEEEHSALRILCRGCKCCFTSQLGLCVHLKRSLDCRKAIASLCDPIKIVSRHKDLRNGKHKLSPVPDDKNDSSVLYLCEKCGALFTTIWGYRAHERNTGCKPDVLYSTPKTITPEEAEKIKEARKLSGSKTVRDSQKAEDSASTSKKATKERSCKTCCKHFDSTIALKEHCENTPSCSPNRRVYKCPSCLDNCEGDLLFLTHFANQHHKSSRLKKVDKKYKCFACPIIFVEIDQMIRHVYWVHMNNFFCPACDFETNSFVKFYEHAGSKHAKTG